MNFEFENRRRELKGGEIHTVKIEDIKFEKLQGTKDPTASYNTFVVTFGNEDGYYTHRIFDAGDKSAERPVFGQFPSASPDEQLVHFTGQLICAYNEQLLEKVKGKSIKPFEQFVTNIAKLLKGAIGKETQIKLMLKKDGRPTLPIYVGVNKEGKAYASSKFVGNGLSFTAKEYASIQKMQEMVKNTKPTSMADVSAASFDMGTTATSTADSSDDDWGDVAEL